MIYQTNLATTELQESANTLLSQVVSEIQSLAGGPESQELVLLTTIRDTVALASKQDTQITALGNILAAFAPLASQATSLAIKGVLDAIAASQANQATAAKQDTQIASLASIDAKLSQPTSGVITQIARSGTSSVILASNANRKGFYLYNDSGAKMYIAFAATASASAYTLQLGSNTGYESPQANSYKGTISGIWTSGGSGSLQVTELT